MTIKSEDVRPPKRTTKAATAKPRIKAGDDINMKSVNPRDDMLAAIDQYETSLKTMSGGKIWLKMERDNASFTTYKGVKFTRDNPYQLVDEDEVDILLHQNFRKAYPDEIRDFYESK
jgi:hypothetical protein